MGSSSKNKQLVIDVEALSTLALVQEGLLSPVTKLMNSTEANEVDNTKMYHGVPFPFSFILAPYGDKNSKVLKSLTKGDIVELLVDGKVSGQIIVDETFQIDVNKRLQNIYGTSDRSHPGVKNTAARLGEIAVAGEYEVEYPLIQDNIRRINEMQQKTNASNISSLMLAANPLNRAHERVIRQAISESDLLIIFLRKPFNSEGLRYDIRYDSLTTFINNFLPKNKVIVIPFENSYIFAGYNEVILDAILAKNYGANQLVVGKNHGGLGLYYDKNKLNSIFDKCVDIGISIKTIEEYVYCDTCKTLVTMNTCLHGQHHHVHYNSESIMKLIQTGLIPPSILVRKEVTANILASLFPNRFDNLQELTYSLMPGSGLLEQQNDEEFYRKLITLYQTSSLN